MRKGGWEYTVDHGLSLPTGMSNSPLDPVNAYLREHPHPRITPEMVASRAMLIEDPQRPDVIVFDVEKRRNALGARYSEQRPLAAFVTYWERYCFDQHNEELHRIGTNVAPNQTSAVTVHSVSRLLKDYVERVLGLLDRAWP